MSSEPYSSLLEEAMEAWEEARLGIIAEAEVIPDARYGWRPVPESRSAGELLRHILESSLMATGELAREDGDFTRQGYPEFIEEYAGDLPAEMDPADLRQQLRTSFESGREALLARGELHMLERIRRFDGLRGTRLAWFQHLVAHEYYHRGQIALYARQMGIVPALTRKIQAG